MPDKPSPHKKTDRIIAGVAIAVGGGLAAYAILQATGFADQFVPPNDPGPGDTVAQLEALEGAATQTRALVGFTRGDEAWTRHEAAGRRRGFLVSTNLVLRRGATPDDDVVIDLDKEEPMLRPPIPNEWLVRHNLQYEYANVGELDPDRDFFSNQEEYEFGLALDTEFDPQDPASHPPRHFLLTFTGTEEEPYNLQYSSGQGNEFFFRRQAQDRADRWSTLAILGETFGGRNVDVDRFLVEEARVEEREIEGMTITETKGVVTVVDSTRPEGHPLRRFEITEGETIDLPVIQAVFDYPPTPGRPLIVNELQPFTLPGTDAPRYTLIEVDDNSATLEYAENGEILQLVVPIGGRAQP